MPPILPLLEKGKAILHGNHHQIPFRELLSSSSSLSHPLDLIDRPNRHAVHLLQNQVSESRPQATVPPESLGSLPMALVVPRDLSDLDDFVFRFAQVWGYVSVEFWMDEFSLCCGFSFPPPWGGLIGGVCCRSCCDRGWRRNCDGLGRSDRCV